MQEEKDEKEVEVEETTFTLSSAPAHRLFTTLKSHESVQTGHLTTMARFAMSFSSLVGMCTNHLANKS